MLCLGRSRGKNPRGLRPLGFWPWDLPRHNIHHGTSKVFSWALTKSTQQKLISKLIFEPLNGRLLFGDSCPNITRRDFCIVTPILGIQLNSLIIPSWSPAPPSLVFPALATKGKLLFSSVELVKYSAPFSLPCRAGAARLISRQWMTSLDLCLPSGQVSQPRRRQPALAGLASPRHRRREPKGH